MPFAIILRFTRLSAWKNDTNSCEYCSFSVKNYRPKFMLCSLYYQRLEHNTRVSQLKCLMCVESNTDIPVRGPTKTPTSIKWLPTIVLLTSLHFMNPSNNLISILLSAFTVEVQSVNENDKNYDTMDNNVYAFFVHVLLVWLR